VTKPPEGPAGGAAGRFGPKSYVDWRATSLGAVTEELERRLILRLAGDVTGCRVLDVGCGDGALPLALWRRGAAHAVGCDVDPRMIARAAAEAARQEAPIDYVMAGVEHLPYADHSFDLVSMITVLAFVRDPDVALREIARVLRPGGRLVLGDLGKWNLWAASHRVRAWLGAGQWQAARFRTSGELHRLVAGAGLRVKQVSGAIFYPRCRTLARLIAPADAWLGERTTIGAAFIALLAAKP
jgi:SAM-dependent methyltransferase